jgi:GNAT superfamily N-acetyltransferase
MKSNINIRKGQAADLQAVHQLVYELAVYEKAAEEMVATLEDYQESFVSDAFHVLVAEEDSEIVGMALYYPAYSTWKGKMMYLEDFVVKEKCRGKGIGQLLFEAFLEDARHRNCTMVKWQVLDWNTPAVRFYEKMDAIIEKEWWNGKIFLKI